MVSILGLFVIFEGTVLIFIDSKGEIQGGRLVFAGIFAFIIYLFFLYLLSINWKNDNNRVPGELEKSLIVLIVAMLKNKMGESFSADKNFFVITHFFKNYNENELRRHYFEIDKENPDLYRVCSLIKDYPQKIKNYVIYVLCIVASGDKYVSLSDNELISVICKAIGVNEHTRNVYFRMQIKKGIEFEKLKTNYEFKSGNKLNLSQAFNTLGIPESSDTEDIKKKYRELVKQYHPDTSRTDENLGVFHKIVEAYQKIRDDRNF